MLIGAHVSPAGGPAEGRRARRRARRARAIQIFNQSPRAWKPTRLQRRGRSRPTARRWPTRHVDALLIHAVYLLNCGTEDPEIRAKSLDVADARRCGPATRSAPHGVVLHPGSRAKTATSARRSRAPARSSREALAESDRCPLHLENTAGAGGTLGRSFEELAALIEAAGGDERLGLCLDSCHLLASGYDIRTARGPDRSRSTSATASRRPRPARLAAPQRLAGRRWAPTSTATPTLGEGELGEDGCAVFLSEPRFEGLPVRARDAGPRQAARARRRSRGRARCASAGSPRAASEARALSWRDGGAAARC